MYKAKEPVEKVKQDTKKSKFAEELDQMLSLVDQDDLVDLASKVAFNYAYYLVHAYRYVMITIKI